MGIGQAQLRVGQTQFGAAVGRIGIHLGHVGLDHIGDFDATECTQHPGQRLPLRLQAGLLLCGIEPLGLDGQIVALGRSTALVERGQLLLAACQQGLQVGVEAQLVVE